MVGDGFDIHELSIPCRPPSDSIEGSNPTTVEKLTDWADRRPDFPSRDVGALAVAAHVRAGREG